MTAGEGISHAELSRPDEAFRGVQLWVAQPEATRHGEAAFEHHGALPEAELGGATARLLVGELAGESSPARADTPRVGAEVTPVDGGVVDLDLDPGFEHCVVPLDGRVAVGGEDVADVGDIVLLAPGSDHLRVDATAGERWLLLGGEPLGEDITMWWNFVARDRDEITAAYRAWQARDDRFGDVDAPLDRIEAPAPPWLRPTSA